MVLYPEGAIKLQGTGREVLERCDGQRTFGELIVELQNEFGSTDPEKIRDDISAFLEQLQRRRIVDY
jgi:pyrroloquinoline quinone biosynthesis protein D